MNKTELVAAVTEHIDGVDKKTVAKVLDGILDVIPMAVAAGDPVTIPGFGTFDTVDKAERAGRHPQTGAQITIAASRAPKFKPGAGFKGLVNASKALVSA
ncbi:HU family DNA-binding protein [Streptosporangium sp. NPDC005286]|uniref:HU family DNA-binding protein n=1 Tax=Streptosporangium sp. NPDC005286 TaxID=3154463 RepID=UPI0033AFF708